MESRDRICIDKAYGRFALGTIQRTGESIVIDQDSLSTSLQDRTKSFAASPPPMPNLAKLFTNGDIVSCKVEPCDDNDRFARLCKWKAAAFSVAITRKCVANKDKSIDGDGKILEISSDKGIILFNGTKIRFNRDHVFPNEVSNLTDEFKVDDRVYVVSQMQTSTDNIISYKALSVEFKNRDEPVFVPSPITSKGTEDSSIDSRLVNDSMDSIDPQPSPPSVTDGEHRRSIPRDAHSSVHVVDRRSEHRRESRSPSPAGRKQRRRLDSRSRSPVERNRRQARSRSPIHHRDRRRSHSGSSSAYRQDHHHRQHSLDSRDRSPPASHRPPFDGKVEPFDADKYYRSAPKIKAFGSISYCGPKCSLIEDLDKPRRIFFFNYKADDPNSLRRGQCVYFEAVRTKERANLQAYYDADVISILRPEEAERVQEVARYRYKEIDFAKELEAAEHREIDQQNRRRASPPDWRRRSPTKLIFKVRRDSIGRSRSPSPPRGAIGNRRDQSERSTSSGRESRSIAIDKRGSSTATGHSKRSASISRRDQPTSTDQNGKSSNAVANHQRDENQEAGRENPSHDGETVASHFVDRQPFGDNIEKMAIFDRQPKDFTKRDGTSYQRNFEIILADDPKYEDDKQPKPGEEVNMDDVLEVVDTSMEGDESEVRMDVS